MMRGLIFFAFVISLYQVFVRVFCYSGATRNETTEGLISAIHEHLLLLRNSDWGWDFGNTPRAVIALSLANETFFRSEVVQATLIKKQLQLEIALSIARQHKEAISVGKLALYINALLAICQDPHVFFEFNLVKKMKHVEVMSNYEEALKTLALCNSGHHLHKHDILSLNNLLQNNSSSQYNSDAKAIALMALICDAQLYPNTFVKSMLHEPIELIKSQQRVDGSFGNIYSTGLALQVLISMGDFGINWKFDQAIRFIISQYEEMNSHSDVLSYFFILPVLNLKSMVHLRSIDCNSSSESDINEPETSALSHNENDVRALIFDNNSSLSLPMNAITYSIKCDFCEFQNATISTVVMIYDGDTLLYVMDKAALSDDRFHYSAKNTSAGLYVQSIAGLSTDVSNNKYWLIYQQESVNNKYKPLDKGVTMIQPKNGDHYIFWYQKV